MTIMKSQEFIDKAIDIAKNYKTLYIKGCFGAPMTASNKKRYSNNLAYNRKRASMINAASSDTFGFDCVCLIKGILWGWSGNKTAPYGGAKYGSNGVPDVNTEGMLALCSSVSSNFSNIVAGEVVWMQGHIGIYIGNGLAVECTPKWKNKVQITAVGNIGKKVGYDTRTWVKHGKLPFIDYSSVVPTPLKPTPNPTPTPIPQPKPTQTYTGKITFQAYANGRWWSEISSANINSGGSNSYAGVIGIPINAIRAKAQYGNIYIQSHTKGGNWNSKISSANYSNGSSNSYSGIIGKPIDGVKMWSDCGHIDFRVHIKGGGWLDWIDSRNCNGTGGNSYAGIIGKEIDAIQMK